MIQSPRDALYQKLIPLGIGDVATLALSWSALGLEVTGSGLTLSIVATAELAGAGTVLAALALPGALIGGALVFGAMIAAPFITENEGFLRDITEGVSQIHPFLSPSTQLLVGVSAPFMKFLPTNPSDPFALQKLGGAVGDLLTGGLTGSSEERFLSVAGSLAGAPGWLEDVENFRNAFSPSSSAAPPSNAGVSQGNPFSVGGSNPFTSGAGGGGSAGEGLYPFSPGLGDSGSYFSGADGGGSDSTYNGDGFSMTINVGGSGPETPGAPSPIVDPPAFPDPPAPPEVPEPPAPPDPYSPPEPASPVSPPPIEDEDE